MLPGIRFLFGAIVLSMSILIFGLGATALLRTAREEVASAPAWRAAPEPQFAQSGEATTPVLALMRVEDAPKAEPKATDQLATHAPATAEPAAAPPAIEPAPAKTAELPQTNPSPVETPKPEARLSDKSLEVTSAQTQSLPIQNSQTPDAGNQPQIEAAPVSSESPAIPEPTKVATTEQGAPAPPVSPPQQASPPVQASPTVEVLATKPISPAKHASPEEQTLPATQAASAKQASSTVQPLPTEQDSPAAQVTPSAVPSANQAASMAAPAPAPIVPTQASEPDAADASNISTKIATLGGPPVPIEPGKSAKATRAKPEPKTEKKAAKKHAPVRRRIVRARTVRARIARQAPPQPLDPFGQPTITPR